MKVFGTLERAQAELLSADPTGAGLLTGRFFYNTTGNDLKYYNGSVRTVVNVDEAQTLTGKTLTGNTMASLSPDGVETITFPVATATLATLDQAETLSNKSLPVTLLPHQSTPSAPAAGNISMYSKNDNKLYIQDENGNETPVGSGGGGALNFYEKGDADLAQVGEFSQGSDPTFGNGGSTSSTFALTTSNPARGTKAFQMTLNATPSASNNDYVRSELIPIPLGYRGQFLAIKFRYNYNGNDNDIKFVVRDETNSVIMTDTTETLPKYDNANGYKEFDFIVYVAQSCENISIGPQVVSHSVGSEVLKWDDAIVTPDTLFSKDVVHMTEWENWTPTGSWISGCQYFGKKRRVGDTMEIEVSVFMTGAVTAANLEVDLPSGIVIDGSKQWSTNVRKGYGNVQIRDASIGNHYDGSVRGVNTTRVQVMWQGSAATTTPVDASSPITFSNDDSITFTAKFPVVGWEVYQENIITQANVGDVGSIQAFGTTQTPDGFLYCDGSSVRRDEYPDLFASIGTAYGTADGDHFNLPDFRGNFMRGYDGVGADPDAASRVASKPGGNTGDNIGSYQSHAIQSHTHSSPYQYYTGASSPTRGASGGDAAGAPQQTSTPNSANVSTETRPVNVTVRYYIRYRSSVTTAALPKVYAGIVGDVRQSMLTEAQFQTYAGEGWVLMDGRSVAGSAYAALTGNNNIPDARGRALRMKDNGAGVNPVDLALGANQGDAFQSHTHNYDARLGSVQGDLVAGSLWLSRFVTTQATTGPISGTSDSETRMKNTTVNFFVKIN